MVKHNKPKKEPSHCNFCGKHKDAVQKLIIGDGIGICNDCVTFCVEILKDTELKKDNINLDPIIIKEYLDASNYFLDNSQTKYLNALLDNVAKKLRSSNA